MSFWKLGQFGSIWFDSKKKWTDPISNGWSESFDTKCSSKNNHLKAWIKDSFLHRFVAHFILFLNIYNTFRLRLPMWKYKVIFGDRCILSLDDFWTNFLSCALTLFNQMFLIHSRPVFIIRLIKKYCPKIFDRTRFQNICRMDTFGQKRYLSYLRNHFDILQGS